MPRLPHGKVVTFSDVQKAAGELASLAADNPLAFTAGKPFDPQAFDYLFPDLQGDPDNLLPESPETVQGLIALGQAMRDTGEGGDSRIPAIYTYFGQFVDHDITLEITSGKLPELLDPALEPLTRDDVRAKIRNARTATLDLDSVYGVPAPRDGDRMVTGRVTPLGGNSKPRLRPPGKDDDNDLPREPRSADPAHDRAALTGDPRNDENLVIAQLHLAFLRAHNALVGRGMDFERAGRLLRQHYQHLVVHDFLPKIVDPRIVDRIVRDGNQVYDAMAEPFFLPLEFTVGAYRFGHTMVRADYNFNLNFNRSGEPGTFPATLGDLFTFTALSGEVGGTDTLPDNWIVEWENLAGPRSDRARLIDTRLVEPLFELPDIQGMPQKGDAARLAVRNLLRGYLLRMPTGQAVARALGFDPLTPDEILGSVGDEQADALRAAGFLERTPLWYYVLAEALVREKGRRLGPVGGTLVAEVLIGLVRRSNDSILNGSSWQPTLGVQEGVFELTDLLRLAGVLGDGPKKKAGKKMAGFAAPTGSGTASLADGKATPIAVEAHLETGEDIRAARIGSPGNTPVSFSGSARDQRAILHTDEFGELIWGMSLETNAPFAKWSLKLTKVGGTEGKPDQENRTDGSGIAKPRPRGRKQF
jgi:hypothetical protein